MKRIYILLILFLTACSSHKVYEVGNSKIHIISEPGVTSPSVTAVLQEGDGGNVKSVYSSSGTPTINSIISGGSIVGASYLYGSSVEPDEVSVSNDSGDVKQKQKQKQSQKKAGRGK